MEAAESTCVVNVLRPSADVMAGFLATANVARHGLHAGQAAMY
jgi:hypothetical protein